MARSVAVMERDEANGMPPKVIARRILSLALRKNPPVAAAGGAKYAVFLFLRKILPKRLVSYIIGKLYG